MIKKKNLECSFLFGSFCYSCLMCVKRSLYVNTHCHLSVDKWKTICCLAYTLSTDSHNRNREKLSTTLLYVCKSEINENLIPIVANTTAQQFFFSFCTRVMLFKHGIYCHFLRINICPESNCCTLYTHHARNNENSVNCTFFVQISCCEWKIEWHE